MATPLITIQGNIVNDPEFKQLPNGNLLKFRVLTKDSVKLADGTWEEKNLAGWNIECWGRLADAAKDIVKKGTTVTVLANRRESSYEDKDGKKVWREDFRATNLSVDIYSLDKIGSKRTAVNNDSWDTFIPDDVPTPF